MFVLQGRRDPKKSDFSPVVQTSHRLGPGPTHNSRESASFDLGSMRESKDNKLSNHRLSHVPAVFPYEGLNFLDKICQHLDYSFPMKAVLLSLLSSNSIVTRLDFSLSASTLNDSYQTSRTFFLQEFEAAKKMGSSGPGQNSVDSLDTVHKNTSSASRV